MHPHLNELKNKLVEADMTFKVSKTLNGRTSLGGTALGSQGSQPVACRPAFPTRQSRPTFGTWPWRWSTSSHRSFDTVVEKWDSSKIGGKRGDSKGKQGSAKGCTTATWAGTFNTRAAAQDAASSIYQVAGVSAAAQAALFQTLTAALSNLSRWQRTRGASVRRRAVNKTKNTCALSTRPSRRTMEAF
jgi:hypothetical protein